MPAFKIFHILSCEEYTAYLNIDLKTFKIIFNMLLTSYLTTPIEEEFTDTQKETLWRNNVTELFGEIENLSDFASYFIDFINSFIIDDESSSELWMSLTINEFEIIEE